MSAWEYKIVPAPTKGLKARGIKGPEERFAYALETLMNDMGAQGWEFQRAETLPSLERSGLTGTTTEWRNMMVFRRPRADASDAFEHELLPAPTPADETDPQASSAPETQHATDTDEAYASVTRPDDGGDGVAHDSTRNDQNAAAQHLDPSMTSDRFDAPSKSPVSADK